MTDEFKNILFKYLTGSLEEGSPTYDEIFESVKSCATYYGINVSTLSTWLNGYINMPKEYKEKGLKFYK